MSAIQQVERAAFGAARLYATDSTGQKYWYADMSNLSVSLKTDLKEYYAEGTFAAGVANGHTTIDISAERYKLSLKSIATDLGLAAPAASTFAVAEDEPGLIPGVSTYTVTLVNAATAIANSEVVYVTHTTTGGVNYDLPYVRVATTPVAGVSYTIAAGVLTFAAGDAGLATKVTYNYTLTTGSQITLNNVAQNSGAFYSMQLVKKDKSPIDGSNGLFIVTFNAVRAGGLDLPSKENDWNVYKGTMKAFADPSGIVAVMQFVNV